uniref:Uncharacterized protein n=1 Tax=Oryza meridionalis TaxID=40149 RepID=A0A0E0CGI7_9ORYZ
MGLELDLLSAQLPPIRTAAAAAELELPEFEEVVLCSTPTAAASVLRAPSVCPPPPRKPRRPATKRRKKDARFSRSCYCCGRRRGGRTPPAAAAAFVAVPDDLAKVFVPRRPVPCRPPPDGEKIGVHVVG